MTRQFQVSTKNIKFENQKINQAIEKLNNAVLDESIELNKQSLSNTNSIPLDKCPLSESINADDDIYQIENTTLNSQGKNLLSLVIHNPVFNKLLTLPEVQISHGQLSNALKEIKVKYAHPALNDVNSSLDSIQKIAWDNLNNAFLATYDEFYSSKLALNSELTLLNKLIEDEVQRIKTKKQSLTEQRQKEAKAQKNQKSAQTLNNISSEHDASNKSNLSEQEKSLLKAYDFHLKIKQACDDGSFESINQIQCWLDEIRSYYEDLLSPLGILDVLDTNLYVSPPKKSVINNSMPSVRECAQLFFSQLFSDEYQISTDDILDQCNEEKALIVGKPKSQLEPSCLSFFTATIKNQPLCFVAPSSLHSAPNDNDYSKNNNDRKMLGGKAQQLFKRLKEAQYLLNSNQQTSTNATSMRYIVLDIHNSQFDLVLESILLSRYKKIIKMGGNLSKDVSKYPHMNDSGVKRKPNQCCAEKRFTTTIAKLIANDEEAMRSDFKLVDSLNCNLSKKQAPSAVGANTNHKFADLEFKLNNDKKYYTATKTCCPNCKANQVPVYATLLSIFSSVDSRKKNVAEDCDIDFSKIDKNSLDDNVKHNIDDVLFFKNDDKYNESNQILSPLLEREVSTNSFDFIQRAFKAV